MAAPVVAARCRPTSSDAAKAVTVASEKCLHIGVLPFSFDHVFDSSTTTEHVYRKLGAPLIGKAIEGMNSTLLAYGQTSAGKTHTMTGTHEDPGVIPRLVAELFDQVAAIPEGTKAEVTVSMLQIHNECIGDLLAPSPGGAKLDIREDATGANYVHGLSWIDVSSAAQVAALEAKGNATRATAATNANASSSRSHMIFSLRLVQTTQLRLDGARKELRATINLVDLAGSERASRTGATGELLKEGSSINKSLSALGKVVHALAEASRLAKKRASAGSKREPAKGDQAKADQHGRATVFVPYRDSKLTRCLQDSLGGNSVTVMLVAISPGESEREETLATLHFAERAKAITLQAKRNERISLEAAAVAAAAEAKRAATVTAATTKRTREGGRATTPAVLGSACHHDGGQRSLLKQGSGQRHLGPTSGAARKDVSAKAAVAKRAAKKKFDGLCTLQLCTLQRDFWPAHMEWDADALPSDGEDDDHDGGDPHEIS